MRILVVLACAFVAACGPDRNEREIVVEEAAVGLARETMVGGYMLITTAELSQALATGEELLVIDARPADDYEKAHLPGAVSFEFAAEESDEWRDGPGGTRDEFLAVLGEDPQRSIVFYCGNVACARSHEGARWARRAGFENVWRFSGGISAWKGAGGATE